MTRPATIGLFEGVSALSLAVEGVFDAELIAYSEHEPPTEKNPRPTQAAARLLAVRRPGVPNLGDITQIDWSAVHVEAGRLLILTGGFPCQDLSLAGLGAGLRPGTRSGLWSHMAYAIACMRPDFVVIENVRGLLSADAACDLEPCPWCVGDDEGRPLRALGAVLGDLADIGYDAVWVGLRAADVGAPHGRFRVFVLAWPAANTDRAAVREQPVAEPGRGGPTEPRHARLDAVAADAAGAGRTPGGPEGRRGSEPADAGDSGPAVRSRSEEPRRRSSAAPDTERSGRSPGDGRPGQTGTGGPTGTGEAHRAEPRPGAADPATDTASIGRGEGWPEPARLVGGPDAPVGGVRAATDADVAGHAGSGVRGSAGPAAFGDGAPAAADAVRDGREGREERDLGAESGEPAPHGGDAARRVLEWGEYEPAIRRWELILERPAPAPTQTGAKGGQQLSPRFVEWLMGLPEGWVTDPEIGLTRNEQLARLGNGVVPQQAAAALRYLLGATGRADLQRVAS